MKLSSLISQLKSMLEQHGDVNTFIYVERTDDFLKIEEVNWNVNVKRQPQVYIS